MKQSPYLSLTITGWILIGFALVNTMSGCRFAGSEPIQTLNEAIEGDANLSREYARPTRGDASSFGKHFREHGRIFLTDEILIGSIGQLDVDYERQKLLVLDRVGNSVILYSYSGELLAALSPEECRPGTSWRPNSAQFRQDGSISVTLQGAGIFYFDEDGKCLDAIMEYFPPRFMAFDSGGEIWGFRARRDGYSLELAKSTGELKHEAAWGSAFRVLMSRQGTGGLEVDNSGRVFIAFPFDHAVYRYDVKKQDVEALGPQPSYYRALQEDLQESKNMDGREAMRAIQQMKRSTSLTHRLLMLDENALMVIYLNMYELPSRVEKSIGINVLSTEGEPLVSEEIQTSTMFAAASGGYAFTIEQPANVAGKMDTNPSIRVYRFVGAKFD